MPRSTVQIWNKLKWIFYNKIFFQSYPMYLYFYVDSIHISFIQITLVSKLLGLVSKIQIFGAVNGYAEMSKIWITLLSNGKFLSLSIFKFNQYWLLLKNQLMLQVVRLTHWVQRDKLLRKCCRFGRKDNEF